LQEAATAVAGNLAQSDPKAALEWLGRLPSGTARAQAAQSLVWQLPLEDMESADALLGMVPANQRDHVQGSLLNRLAEHDFDAALSWLKQMPDGRGKQQALNQFSWRWIQTAPAAAAEYASTLPPGRSRDDFLRNVAMQWSNQDPEAAVRWATALDDPRVKQQALTAALGSWSGQEPQAAATYVAGLPPGRLQNEAAVSVAANWAGEDPAAALDWVRGFGDDPTRRNALQSVISRWATDDPAGAGAWVQSQPAGAERTEIAAGLARNLAWSNPTEAVRWADFVGTDSAEFRSIASTLASAWANQDPKAGGDWLKSLPAGEAREMAVSSFVSAAAHSQPEVAAAWATTLSDENQRRTMVQMTFTQWAEQDAARAERWLQSVELPAEFKDGLLEQARQRAR
jgi:hypothetical protein